MSSLCCPISLILMVPTLVMGTIVTWSNSDCPGALALQVTCSPPHRRTAPLVVWGTPNWVCLARPQELLVYLSQLTLWNGLFIFKWHNIYPVCVLNDVKMWTAPLCLLSSWLEIPPPPPPPPTQLLPCPTHWTSHPSHFAETNLCKPTCSVLVAGKRSINS